MAAFHVHQRVRPAQAQTMAVGGSLHMDQTKLRAAGRIDRVIQRPAQGSIGILICGFDELVFVLDCLFVRGIAGDAPVGLAKDR